MTLSGTGPQATPTADPIRQYCGLRGWLVLVGFGIVVTGIVSAATVYQDALLFSDGTVRLLTDPASGVHAEGYSAALRFELAYSLVLVLASVYLLFLYYAKSRLFPKLYIAFLLSGLAGAFVDLLLVVDIANRSSGIKAFLDPEIAKLRSSLGPATISTVVWVWYAASSQRVRQTFVGGLRQREPIPGVHEVPHAGHKSDPADPSRDGLLRDSASRDIGETTTSMPALSVGRPARPIRLLLGCFFLAVPVFNSYNHWAPNSDPAASLVGALAGLAAVVALAIWLITSGLPLAPPGADISRVRRRLWWKLVGLGFVVMVVVAPSLAMRGWADEGSIVTYAYWFGWTWIAWIVADRNARRQSF